MSPKSRWGLRRVTAHVSWPIQLLNRLVFVPAFFHWMEEGAPHWVNRDKELAASPAPLLLVQPTAARIALACLDGPGWRQARVQVSARAPLLS